MRICVRMFAMARQLVGADQIELELPAASKVRDLRETLLARFPQSAPLLRSSLIAVDTKYASEDTPITERNEIAVIPPVSGG